MFDVGFSELVLVGVIALVVFGPERLPRLAREAALWIRKARSLAASVREDINRELQLQELQETLKEQQRALDFRKAIEPSIRLRQPATDRGTILVEETTRASSSAERPDGES